MAPADTPPPEPAIRFLLAAKRLRVRDLEQLVMVGGLVGEISGLIHALQRERGTSNVYLASGGRDFADRLGPAVADSRQGEAAVRAMFDRLEAQLAVASFAPRLFGRIAYVLHAFEALDPMRCEIAGLKVSPEQATQFFVELIAGLLTVVFEASDTTADPVVSRALVAMFNFMQGKEFAGQERATAAAGFSAGRFTDAQHRLLLKLIEAQARSFRIFTQFADEPLVRHYNEMLSGPDNVEFERLRRVACVGGPAGELGGIGNRQWYDQATKRMDSMRRVEERIDSGLQALCTAKLAEARADLDDNRNHLKDLVPAEPQPLQQAFVIGELDSTLLADAEKTGIEVYSVDGMSPKLGRSLLDLVHTQFRQMEQMSEELETARLAINERKVVERAKGLLMTHRNLTEQQAYDLLRKTAMSQNRRMKEVAEAVLAMADILSGP